MKIRYNNHKVVKSGLKWGMLTGTYNNQIDDKGRLNFPAKMRAEMGDTFVVTRWLDGCIVAFPQAKWEKISEMLAELPMVKSREIRRFLMAKAEEVSTDKQGRILISSTLREHAGIEKEAVVLGVGTHAEIWSKTGYNKMCDEIDTAKLEEIMEELDF